jgi:hypothetical protein
VGSNKRDTKAAQPRTAAVAEIVVGGRAGFQCAEWLAMQARASNSSKAAVVGQARRVLVIYEEGGISQMDSFDPKPDALLDHRSPFKPIPTSVPGTHFSELMPLTAKQAHRLSRGAQHDLRADGGGHKECCQEFFKGYRNTNPFDFPDIGCRGDGADGHRPAGNAGATSFVPGINMPNAITSTGFLPASRAPVENSAPKTSAKT